jgi:hypothetical protein
MEERLTSAQIKETNLGTARSRQLAYHQRKFSSSSAVGCHGHEKCGGDSSRSAEHGEWGPGELI